MGAKTVNDCGCWFCFFLPGLSVYVLAVAPLLIDHRVRKVGRGMTAAATNLGTMFGTGGRREWERNFSLGLQ